MTDRVRYVTAPSERALRRVLRAALLTWCAALLLATIAAARQEKEILAYLASTGVYFAGSLVCHQRPERSFHLWGAQFPVCARCAGIYFGAATAVLLRAVGARARLVQRWSDDPVPARALLAVALAPSVATLLYEWTTGVMPSHPIRAAAGALLGAPVAWLLVRLR